MNPLSPAPPHLSANPCCPTPPFFLPHPLSACYRDELDRKLQVERSAELLSNASSPVVVLSDITTPSGSRDYLTLTEHGRVKVGGACRAMTS